MARFRKRKVGSETCQFSEASAPQKPHVGKNFHEHKMNVYVKVKWIDKRNSFILDLVDQSVCCLLS
jgi:hypothetical protein